jgi:hypothetical protein
LAAVCPFSNPKGRTPMFLLGIAGIFVVLVSGEEDAIEIPDAET